VRGAQGGAGGEGTGAVESADSTAMIGAGADSAAMIGAGAGRGAVIGAGRAGAWLLAGLAALLLFAFPYAERTRNANERPRLLQGMALVDTGSFAIDGPGARGLDPGPDVARDPLHGALYPNKPPGASLVAALAYAGARALTGDEPLTLRRYTWWARLLGGVLPTLLLCAWLARRFAGPIEPRAVWLALGLYALATPAFAYAHLLYGHQLTALLLWGGALLVVDACRADRALPAALGGLLAASAVAVEYSAAFAGPPLALFVLMWARRGRWRAALAAGLGAAVPMALLGLYHANIYGGPLRTGYHHVINPEFAAKHGEGFLGLVAPSWTALHAHILSSQGGLLWWAPLTVPALAGLWDMSREPGDSALRSHARLHLAIFAALALACVSLNFEGGWRVGPRYLVAVLPALMLGWARALRWLSGRGVLLAIVAALLTWSALINGLAGDLWPHFDLKNIHQPVSEVLLPLFQRGRTPYTPGGLGVGLALISGLLGLLWLLRPRGRAQLAAVAIGVGAGLGLIAATRLIAPHPRAAANLAYIEKVWEPPVAGGVAPSTRLPPLPE
jgi:hypothetical protein